MINCQLDVKLREFTKDEVDAVLKIIKNRKAAGFDEIPLEIWKRRKFNDMLRRNTSWNMEKKKI